MQAFIIEAENKPGQLARHAQVLADRGINTEPVSVGFGGRGGMAFLVNDEAATRSAFTDAGIGYREIPTIMLNLEDRPGTAAGAARKLADAGVNIELFVPFVAEKGRGTVVVGVDKVDEARRAVPDLLTDWTPTGAWKQRAKVTA